MSDETKHTPLPWELAAESGVGMISSGTNAIVDFDWYDDNKLENAILIVRAVNAHAKLESERDAYREELDRVRRTAKKHGRLVNIPRSVLVAIEVIARNVLSKYPKGKV